MQRVVQVRLVEDVLHSVFDVLQPSTTHLIVSFLSLETQSEPWPGRAGHAALHPRSKRPSSLDATGLHDLAIEDSLARGNVAGLTWPVSVGGEDLRHGIPCSDPVLPLAFQRLVSARQFPGQLTHDATRRGWSRRHRRTAETET